MKLSLLPFSSLTRRIFRSLCFCGMFLMSEQDASDDECRQQCERLSTDNPVIGPRRLVIYEDIHNRKQQEACPGAGDKELCIGQLHQ